MTTPLSPDTQATLLLTAPLITNGGAEPADTLTRSEYVQLSNTLAKANHTPALLLHSNEEDLPDEVAILIDGDRIQKLLSRGLQLTQL
jgi:DNA processing protein